MIGKRNSNAHLRYIRFKIAVTSIRDSLSEMHLIGHYDVAPYVTNKGIIDTSLYKYLNIHIYYVVYVDISLYKLCYLLKLLVTCIEIGLCTIHACIQR